jgi:hypothetical protein
MDATLRGCERDVEAARARLAEDLRILRQPETVQSFTRAIKIELTTAKDEAVESAKSSVVNAVSDAVERLKSKAAANPAALLAIGAGLAWHFVRNPPVVTALVGAGLFSLLKTPAATLPPGTDFVAEGRERLKEQAGEFAETAKEYASLASEAMSQKVSEVAHTGAQAASDLAQTITGQVKDAATRGAGAAADAADQVADVTGQVTDQVSGQIVRTRHDIKDAIQGGVDAATGAVQHAVQTGAESWSASGERLSHEAAALVPDTPRRQDTILLGIAGVAVAAALGIACQRSVNQQ